MSDWNEKLERPAPETPTRARATRAHLTGQWGFVRDNGDEIHMRGMDWKLVVWRATEIGRGVGQLFEKQD